jgi:hypothetical protein
MAIVELAIRYREQFVSLPRTTPPTLGVTISLVTSAMIMPPAT